MHRKSPTTPEARKRDLNERAKRILNHKHIGARLRDAISETYHKKQKGEKIT
jgi:hypothetical protein